MTLSSAHPAYPAYPYPSGRIPSPSASSIGHETTLTSASSISSSRAPSHRAHPSPRSPQSVSSQSDDDYVYQTALHTPASPPPAQSSSSVPADDLSPSPTKTTSPTDFLSRNQHLSLPVHSHHSNALSPAHSPATRRSAVIERTQPVSSSSSSNFSHTPPELALPPAIHQASNVTIQRSVSYEPVSAVPPMRSSVRKLPAQPPMAKLSPPKPNDEIHESGGAGGSRRDEFEDEVERQAEVMRQERISRRITQAQESVTSPAGPSRALEIGGSLALPGGLNESLNTTKDKGKRRASGMLSDSQHGVLVGNLISEGHVNYVLMYNMLTGIRIGVSRCQAKLKRALTEEDYTARHKFSFDIVGNELTPSAKYNFKFKDYAPWVFRELREYFHLDPADYLLSLTAKYILSELGSPG